MADKTDNKKAEGKKIEQKKPAAAKTPPSDGKGESAGAGPAASGEKKTKKPAGSRGAKRNSPKTPRPPKAEKTKKKKAMKAKKADGGKDEGDGEKRKTKKGMGEEGYTAKAKPKLDRESRRLLKLRQEKRAKKPDFRRQEWFRYKKLGTSWRKPRGLDSKMRRNYKYRPALVHIGYGGPRKVRGLHPSGFQDILVHNVGDLVDLDPKKQAIRIGHGVGTRKRAQIERAAEKKGLRVLNKGSE